MGAAGRATVEWVRSLQAGGEEPPGESIKPEPQRVDSEDKRGTEEEPDAPARVPWLRYTDGPSRVAPSRNPTELPANTGTEKDADEPLPASSAEPLLTPEELAALMSDDIP
jgi:hypothetical protein